MIELYDSSMLLAEGQRKEPMQTFHFQNAKKEEMQFDLDFLDLV